MAISPRQAVDIPLVRINIRDDKGTNRPIFAPIYEAPLLQRLWDGYAKIEVQEPSPVGPAGRPWPRDMRVLHSSMAKEEQRLSTKYAKNPSTKEPVWTVVYGAGQFPDAFARAVAGAWAPTEQAPAPEVDDSDLIDATSESVRPVISEPAAPVAPVGEPTKPETPIEANDLPTSPRKTAPKRAAQIADLSRAKGVSAELAGAIIDTLGVTSLAALAATTTDDLEQVSGVGPVSAKTIAESAQEIVLTA